MPRSARFFALISWLISPAGPPAQAGRGGLRPTASLSRCQRDGSSFCMRAETRKHGSFDKPASGAQNPLMPLAVRLPFILLSTVSYLALAILGRGGFAAFFSVPALIALAVAFCAMSGVALFTGGNLSSGVREDRSNRWVIGAFGVIGLLLAVVPAWADRREIWILDGDTVRWLGVILFAIGGTLRLWPVFVLGRRFSGLVAIQPGHTLVTSGVYSVIRHPSYLGLLVNSLGWALAFRSGVGVLLAAMMIPPILARIDAEERLLRSQFGSEYEAFCARTSRLIPRVY